MTRLRLYLVFLIACAGFSLVLFRAFQLQVLPRDRVQRLAQRQLTQRIEIVGRRGVISDRNGRELAVSVNSSSVYANPKLITEPLKTAAILAAVLQIPREALQKKLELNADRKFIWIKRQLTSSQMLAFKRIDLKKTPGVGILPEYRREYPQGDLASHVLGFVSVDGKGIEGLERTFDNTLAGEKNTQLLNRDAFGRPIFSHSDQVRWEYQKGSDLELSIDARLQFVAESALQETIDYHKAEGGAVIVMDPYNGEILAMANSPSFDSNHPNLSARSSLRNRVLSDPIEPGSTIKPFVVARAIEDKKVTPKTMINTHGGKLLIGKHVISEAEKKHEFKQLSVADVLRYSSNVGIVGIKDQIGFNKVEDTYNDLGFGTTTGVELSGESRGIFVHPKPKQLLEQATISFGQGISLTPMQMTRAYASIANGGYLIRPTLVRKTVSTDAAVPAAKPQVKRVFSVETTRTMAEMLERVVEDEGTGALAKVDGFRVAGKTGTAQRVDYQHGGYEAGSYWSSFIGFIPSRSPRFVIYVMVDRPTRNGYYGATVAAPVFSKVAREALRMHSPLYQMQANLKNSAVVPLKENPLAKNVAKNKNVPTPITTLELIPDIQGLPLRSALRLLEDYPVQVQTQGVGYKVQEQDPKPGSPIPKDALLKVRLN